MKKLLFLLTLLLSVSQAQTIVVSLYPYVDLLQSVAGEEAQVEALLPAGASPHTFDPSPRDVAKLAEADLVVVNGILDEWMLDLLDASGSEVAVLNIMESLDDVEIIDEHTTDEHATDEQATDGHGGGLNPHVWLDPVLMMEAAPLFAEKLGELEPDNAQTYTANAETLVNELNALNTELSELLEPVSGAAFVPFHDAWPYFAKRFELNLVVEIEPAPGREPSPAYIAEALELIKESGAKAVFSEVQLPARPAEVVAENANVALHFLDPIGGAEETRTYADLLRFNASVIADALAPTP